ncbi:MAG: NifU family protein [Candidatus Promineifilaceae bacterium]|jgi:Fe-S cluster biogenesis protein NfuA
MSSPLTGSRTAMNKLPEEASDAERMAALIEVISAYIEHYHGGAVQMVEYDDGVLTIRMSGACDGCELAPVTLHGWVEGTVKQFFPDLEEVRSI